MSKIKFMTIDCLDRVRESEGYRKGRLEGINEAIKVLVDAGIVSKEDCDIELERYMREDFEEDNSEEVPDTFREPVSHYEFCKIEHGCLKGRSAGIDEGVNIVVDAQLAKRKECNQVIKQYRQEQELDKKIQEIKWDTHVELVVDRLDFCGKIKHYNRGVRGVIIGATLTMSEFNWDNAKIAAILEIPVEMVEDIILHKDEEEYLSTHDFTNFL